MNAVVDRWQQFWFPAVPVRRLSLFRIVLTAYALIDIAFVSSYMSRFSRVDAAFHQPILLFRILQVPRLGPGATTIVRGVLIVALACALIGLWTRVSLWVSAILYTYWFGTFYSFHAIEHGRVPIVLSLFALAVAPAGAAYSIDDLRRRNKRGPTDDDAGAESEPRDVLAGWALRLVMVVVVCAYAFAAYSKLRAQGLGWIHSGALNEVLIEKQQSLGLSVARHPGIIEAMSAVTVLTEALSPLLFFRGRIRDIYLAVMVSFHLGTLVLLDISFLGLVLCYLAFYDLEVGFDRVKSWWTDHGARVKPAVRAGAP